MAKDKKTIKYEADISGFKKNIQEAKSSIKTLNNQLKLNQTQLKGNKDSVELLGERLATLKQKYEEQTKVVENTRAEYEKSVEVYGKNSKEAENLKNKLIQAETKQVSIANAIKETNNQLTLQTDKLITTGDKMQKIGDGASKLGDKLNKAGNKLSILSAGVATLAGTSLKASIDYESAWTGVTKTVDGTEEQLANLRQGILDLSTQLPSVATEIAGVAENAGQLGIATEDVLSFTKVMIDLGNSTNLSADEASSALAKFANVTKMSASDYDKLGSTIVALGNNFATTEADIVNMATNLASTGELTGLTQSQILALATAMSSVGIEAEAGGSAMSKLLKKIQVSVETGGQDLTNFSKIAGMTSTEFKKAFQEDAVGALSSFIGGLNDTERNGQSAISVLNDMGLTEVRLSNTVLSLANASDVMTNAVEMSGKAWNENTALTEEASKRYETTESKLQMLKNEIIKNGIALGDELKPALIDVLEEVKPMISNVTNMVKSFNKLDDTTKKNIINIGGMVVALGPALKIGGKAISTIGSGVKSVGTLTKAIGVMKTGVNSGTKEVDSLAKGISSLVSPAGLATISIAAITTAIAYGAQKQREATKATREFAEEMTNQKQEYEEYNKSINDTANANLAQINSVSKLKDELTTLVDENGKVKEEYKSRVDFILNQLNEALGTEYKLNDNVVQGYKELQSEIEGTIEKKRAEIILEASKEKYANAIKNETDAVKNLKEARDKLGMSYDEARKKIEYYEEEKKKYGIIASDFNLKEYENLKNSIKAYEEAESTVKQCTKDKKQYESDYALFVEEKYNEIGKTITETTKEWTDASLSNLKDAISQEKDNLEKYKELYEKTEDELALQQQQQAQQNLQNLANELIARTSTIDTLGGDEILAWKTLANSSYEEYKNAIIKMSPEMQQQVQQATGIIVAETPYAQQVANNYINTIINSLDKDEEFRKEAVDSLNSYLSGLSDEEKRGLIQQAGIQDANKVIEGLRQGKQLSEEQGVEILKGLKTGLQNNPAITSVISQAKNIASRIVGALSVDVSSIVGRTSQNMATASTLPGHKDGLDYVPYDNYVARLHKGERVLTAEENREYMNGNINNKLATNNITVQFFPQSMSNDEMERAFRYVDRKFGTQFN